MVYDTLFAMDAKFQVQPQMVDKWDISNDKLVYTFTLRDGLKFHDGQPVRSADCIASIDHWSKRDALGQKLAEATDAWTAVNDKTFRLKLKGREGQSDYSITWPAGCALQARRSVDYITRADAPPCALTDAAFQPDRRQCACRIVSGISTLFRTKYELA